LGELCTLRLGCLIVELVVLVVAVDVVFSMSDLCPWRVV